MHEIKLIALDLDGTLLNSNKELSAANARALERAAAQGIHIVPTTGRFFSGMPEVIRALPFLRYAISINGAQVCDLQTGEVLYRAELPLAQALDIMAYLDTLPVIYDCYMDNWGRMTRALQERAAEFAPDRHYLKMLRELRTPVPELKEYLRETGHDVQKIQFFTLDPKLRRTQMETLSARFPGTAVSSSVVNNVEINHAAATKGAALTALAAHLGIPMDCVMALGDGDNDVSMLRAAFYGVSMANACESARRSAKYQTASCDEDGVAAAIARFCALD